MSARLPFDRINEAAMRELPSLLADRFPAGRLTGHEFMIGDIQGSPGKSLSINVRTGVWKDFAQNIGGSDPISLFAAADHGGDQAKAARTLGRELGVYTNGHAAPKAQREECWTPMPAAPGCVPSKAEFAFKGRTPDAVWTYHDAAGNPTHYVRRFDHAEAGAKEFVPLTYGNLNGRPGWHAKHPAKPRPLYNLHQLAKRPKAPVMIVEGEKAADAAGFLFPDHVVTTWPGGAGSVHLGDYAALDDHDVRIIWPDNDAAGARAGAWLAAKFPGTKVLEVSDLEEGADAADIMPDDPAQWLLEHMPSLATFGRLRIRSVQDALDAPPRTYLLEGLSAPAELSVWWGPPKSGKSFLMLRIAYGLSQGKGMWGREAARVPVLYVAAEGASGVNGRIRALHETMGDAPDFHHIAQSIDLFDVEADLSDLIAAAKVMKCKLVALDTLARVMGAGDENATRDMNVFVRNCDAIREETGAHVVVVHHGGWDGAHARGSIALIGAADIVVKVTGKDGEPRQAEIEYAKDDPSGEVMGFRLEVHELPPNANGKARATCVVRETDLAAASPGRRGKINEEALTLLRDIEAAIASGYGSNISPGEQIAVCPTLDRATLQRILIQSGWLRIAAGIAENSSEMEIQDRVPVREHDRLYKKLIQLKAKGLIGSNRRYVWLPKAPAAS